MARKTAAMNVGSSTATVIDKIEDACPSLTGTFSVSVNDTVCKYNVDCIHYDLKFDYYTTNLNQFTIIDWEGKPLEGVGLEYHEFDLKQRGPGIMYEAIPFEMIRTAHTNPQILVTIDDLPAICTGICDYTYEISNSLITDMSVNDQ